MHPTKTTYQQETRFKTGYEKAQPHLTVYFGNREDHIQVTGHLYVKTVKRLPTGLMDPTKRWLEKDGRQGRVYELWKYNPRGTLNRDHRVEDIRSKSSWWSAL